MKHNKIGIGGLFLFLLLHHSMKAQLNSSFSDYFDQFYNNYLLLNPSNSDSSYKVAATISNRAQTGLFQGVNKIYLDVDLRIADRRGIKQFVGLQAINNKEGEFISKNRCLLRYGLRIQLSYRSSISAGISGGFINYAFNTSQSGTGGSDWVPDGNAGIWYLRRKLSVGFSMQQIFNQKIRPANQTFLLGDYYTATARYIIPVNSLLNFNTHIYAKFQHAQPIYFVCASLLEIQQIAEAGVGYSYQRGLSYVVGLKKLRISNSRFSFYFSYFVGASKMNVSDNAFELMVSYHK